MKLYAHGLLGGLVKLPFRPHGAHGTKHGQQLSCVRSCPWGQSG
ncbi:hypothetical protein E1A91_A01G122900v1 [Gossypium mustelinum]|uniref:Uncharacterized protein n=1 Tax=Gossypium mustelinum TaxID=34275 RepID=A0A5D3AGP4_GOSMU|nr:hypothetical protein E1A91_A01G122900v1 [Gossypium mustelinum]